jgi:hypothetical protein
MSLQDIAPPAAPLELDEEGRFVTIDRNCICCGDISHKIYPWGHVARGFGFYTVSPIRPDTYICTNLDCRLHKENGEPLCFHYPIQKCTKLEYLVVHSFFDLATETHHLQEQQKRRPEFHDWTTHEMSVAFEHSHFIDEVKRRFHQTPEGLTKMHNYCKIFEKAADFLPIGFNDQEKKRLDLFLTNITGRESGYYRPPLKYLDTQFISARYDLINKSLLEYTREKLLCPFAGVTSNAQSH